MNPKQCLILVGTAVLVCAPSVAFGQDATEVEKDPAWLGFVIGALGYAVLAFIPALTSSNSWWVKIIDALVGNWGKARNDPALQ